MTTRTADPTARTGTWAWAERTGGRLSRAEQVRHAVAFARAVVRARLSRGRPAPASGTLTLAEAPPDSGLARAALAAAQAASSPALLGHCLRSWLYADALAQVDGIEHDRELLFTACVLHDIGLTPPHWGRRAECFGVEGATAAHDLARSHSYPRADDLAEAITLHLQVDVPLRAGAEAHLLHAGTTTDLLGVRARDLPRDIRHRIAGRHPRAGLASEMTGLVARQSRLRPRSRIAVLQRLGFSAAIRAGEHRRA
jgi:HD domain